MQSLIPFVNTPRLVAMSLTVILLWLFLYAV